MSTGPTNVYDFAVTLLNAVENAFTLAAVTLPATRFIHPGGEIPAWCDSLVVSWTKIWIGVAGSAELVQPLRRNSLRTVQFSVDIFRCLPEGTDSQGPSAQTLHTADIQASAQTIMTDAFTLHKGLYDAHFLGTFTDFCTALSLGPATPIRPAGGIGGTTMMATAELV